MCGRFMQTTPAGQVAEVFGVPDPPMLPARYNVAPSQVIAVVGLKPDGTRQGIALLRWGLVPHWSAGPAAGPQPINVRAESVAFKFGSLLRKRRCLILADGFYEWKAEGKSRRPHRFTLRSGEPFGFAGLWDVWGQERDKLVTCCLITTAANDLVGPVHDRMPVILPQDSYGDWLAPETPVARLTALLRPYPADEMRMAEAGQGGELAEE